METKKEIVFKKGFDAIMHFGSEVMAPLPTDFNLDEPVRYQMYKKAYLTLAKKKECEDFGVSSDKGIWFAGDVGVGKSILMRVMQKVFRHNSHKFKNIKTLDFIDVIESGNSEIMIEYGQELKCDLLIDDFDVEWLEILGRGTMVQHIYDLLYARNELFVSHGYRTHLITTLTASMRKSIQENSLHDIYGLPIYDRIQQMTNLFVWEGPSLRK
jgi:DNA replication protein DnaC